jgi:diguanylate cyclase (GGDEF)-like protein/PAS domain S-box-containing protein
MPLRANEGDGSVQKQNAYLRAAVDHMSQALCMVDAQQQLIVCNRRYLELFGLPPDFDVAGRPVREIVYAASRGGRFDQRLIEHIVSDQQELILQGRSATFFHEGAEGRTIAVSHQSLPDGGWLATYEDVTERRQVEARISYMAHHDPLTGLPNRVQLRERVERMLRHPVTGGRAAAILMLDLDHFKNANDSLGHAGGDQLLQVMARRLQGCTRRRDLVTRFGGDEFVLVQAPGPQPQAAKALAERIIKAVAEPFDIDGRRVLTGVSIGVALAPETGADMDLLLRSADLALYQAKADGRSTWRLYETSMDARVQTRRALSMDLQDAAARGQLALLYQPLVDLAADRIGGFEAVLRWYHPQLGLILPGLFVPIAEEMGLIPSIGDWVLHRACCDAATWANGVTVSVNLSPLQIRGTDLVRTVRSALARSGLPARRLQLEIAETVVLQHSSVVLTTLTELRALGVSFALDNFGMGYSSLRKLRGFPFDRIKLDRSFVQGLQGLGDCGVFTRSVAALGRGLGMTVTAEGVETVDQLATMRAAGCVEAQGLYFGAPMSAAAAARAAVSATPLGASAGVPTGPVRA